MTAVVGIAGDVTDWVHRAALVSGARGFGPVQLLVNNASTLGASPLPSVAEISGEVLRSVFEVNVMAPIALIQAFDAHLAPGATIISISSDAAAEPYPGWSGYGASKAALGHVSRIHAVERPDLRILVVDPGDMRTEMHQDAFPGEDISDRPMPTVGVPGLLALITGDQPSGRYEAREFTPVESGNS